jgi:hypothetical protein
MLHLRTPIAVHSAVQLMVHALAIATFVPAWHPVTLPTTFAGGFGAGFGGHLEQPALRHSPTRYSSILFARYRRTGRTPRDAFSWRPREPMLSAVADRATTMEQRS